MADQDYDYDSYEAEVHIVEGPSDPFEFFLEWEYFGEVLVTDSQRDFLATVTDLAKKAIAVHDREAESTSDTVRVEDQDYELTDQSGNGTDREQFSASETDRVLAPAKEEVSMSKGQTVTMEDGAVSDAESDVKNLSESLDVDVGAETAGETKPAEPVPESECPHRDDTSSDSSSNSTLEDSSEKSPPKVLELDSDAAAVSERRSWLPDYLVRDENFKKQVAEEACQMLNSDMLLMDSGDDGNDPLTNDFIPVPDLALESLPDKIRSLENLQLIKDVARRVVRIRLPGTSEGRRSDDPLSDHVLYGTGVVVMVLGNVAVVAASKHVLQDADEVKASSIDFFFDSETEWYSSIQCTNGIGVLDIWKDNEDLTMALYLLKDAAAAILSEFHGLQSAKLSWPAQSSQEFSLTMEMRNSSYKKNPEASQGEHTVCVVSHPLGRAKHVTFGSVVPYKDAQKKELYHNAKTRYGSISAPLLVFAHVQASRDSIWYHLGRSLDRDGLKIARLQKFSHQRMLRELENPHRFGSSEDSDSRNSPPDFQGHSGTFQDLFGGSEFQSESEYGEKPPGCHQASTWSDMEAQIAEAEESQKTSHTCAFDWAHVLLKGKNGKDTVC